MATAIADADSTLSRLRSVLARPWREFLARGAIAFMRSAERARARGDRRSAVCSLHRAAFLDAANPLVHSLMGRMLAEGGSYDQAKKHFRRALAIDPRYCDAYIDLGTAYRLDGNLVQAASMYHQALEIEPAAPLAHYNLGLLLVQQGSARAALPHLRAAHLALPDHGDMLRSLVTALLGEGEYQDAVSVAKTAVETYPSYEAWICLGIAYQKFHRVVEALACYDKALEFRADDPELYNNRAIALQDLGALPAALASYDSALALRDDFPLARYYRALARLLTGDYENGWPDYELRLLSKEYRAWSSAYPRWDGSPGKSVLIYGEQGLGDELMFASCIPDLLAAAGNCAIACSARLQPLFQRSFPNAIVYASNQESERLATDAASGIDCEIPLGSLPQHFRRSKSDFPHHTGYLRADARRIAAWKSRLDAMGTGLKVGISWRGGTHKSRSDARSIALKRWLPILSIDNVRFVSLQYTADAAADIARLRSSTGASVLHWPEAIEDYDETAALVTALDLTLTVCTAVVHLAGALGRPVWIMAPYSPEWRYGLVGERMSWYPSARLFRQPSHGAWDRVIDEVSAGLLQLSCAESLSQERRRS